jgi:hypothetical protein
MDTSATKISQTAVLRLRRNLRRNIKRHQDAIVPAERKEKYGSLPADGRPMMIWSIKRICMISAALIKFSVIRKSALLGEGSPDGWLWMRMNA